MKEIQKKFYNRKIGLRIGSIANYYGGGSTLSGNTSIFKSLSNLYKDLGDVGSV